MCKCNRRRSLFAKIALCHTAYLTVPETNEHERHGCCKQPVVAAPWLAGDVHGQRHLGNEAQRVALLERVVFRGEGADGFLPTEVEQHEGRPCIKAGTEGIGETLSASKRAELLSLYCRFGYKRLQRQQSYL